MFRPNSNSMRVTEVPSLTAELMRSIPGMLAIASSTRRVTSVSSVEGDAPGSPTDT